MIASLRKISWYLMVRLLPSSLVIRTIAPRYFTRYITQMKSKNRFSALEEPELAGLGDRLAAGGGAQFPVDRLGLCPDGVG
jgi:hypothetical protein